MCGQCTSVHVLCVPQTKGEQCVCVCVYVWIHTCWLSVFYCESAVYVDCTCVGLGYFHSAFFNNHFWLLYTYTHVRSMSATILMFVHYRDSSECTCSQLHNNCLGHSRKPQWQVPPSDLQRRILLLFTDYWEKDIQHFRLVVYPRLAAQSETCVSGSEREEQRWCILSSVVRTCHSDWYVRQTHTEIHIQVYMYRQPH